MVPPPAPLGQRERTSAFTAALRAAGYDPASCARRLGVFSRLGINFWPEMRPDWKPSPDTALDTLVSLFIDGQPVAKQRLGRHLPSGQIDAALEMRLVEEVGPDLQARLCLFPCYGKYLVTDRALKNTAINQVMWLWGESYLLGGMVKRTPRRRAIDIGTGSGVHAVLAGDHCQRVTCVDVNPRALEFARFNAWLNGLEHFDFVLSDVFSAVDGTCDLLTANPPYAPDDAASAGDNFWSGGHDGMDILGRIVEGIPSRLDADGTAHIIALYPNPPGSKIRDHFDRWLAGNVDAYQVLDHTWPVPHYTDVLSEKPFVGNKSAWRFGVVSLRRAADGRGWWKEVGGKGLFFGRDGQCAVVADHEAA
jgi:SAM-dependent methyltransferase